MYSEESSDSYTDREDERECEKKETEKQKPQARNKRIASKAKVPNRSRRAQ